MRNAAKSIVLALALGGVAAGSASAQTALRLGTNDLFQANSAILTKKGQVFLEDYLERQKCQNFKIVGYQPAESKDALIRKRARVIRGLARRYQAKASVEIQADGDVSSNERRVEVYPEECAEFAPVIAAGLGLGAAAGGLAAVVILGAVTGGTSTPHTN